jgi:hypothetical protein
MKWEVATCSVEQGRMADTSATNGRFVLGSHRTEQSTAPDRFATKGERVGPPVAAPVRGGAGDRRRTAARSLGRAGPDDYECAERSGARRHALFPIAGWQSAQC